MAIRPKFSREIRVYGSDLIHKVRYDIGTSTLDVKLKSGQAYRYRNIYPGAFTSLVTLESCGKIYNEEIKRTHFGVKRKATKIRSW